MVSALPEASVLPSGLKATALTELLWPSRVARSLLGGHIPELEGGVVTARGQRLAIGTEGHGRDRVAMAFEGSEQLPRGHIPELEGGVVTARGQGLAIGTEGHGSDRVAMAELQEEFSRMVGSRGGSGENTDSDKNSQPTQRFVHGPPNAPFSQ